MLVTEADITQIRDAFGKMNTREDFLNLLNQAKPLVYGERAVPFELKQLTWYANPKHEIKRYVEFKIKKKSGSERTIHAPVKGLKAIQKTLSFILQCVFEPHKAAMGFVRNKSIVDNARIHTGSKYVYNIDLKDFFPSIDQARVWACFQLKPFNLNGNPKVSTKKISDSEISFTWHRTLPKTFKYIRFIVSGANYQNGYKTLVTDTNDIIEYLIKNNASEIIVFKYKGGFQQFYKKFEKAAGEEYDDAEYLFSYLIGKLIKANEAKYSASNSRLKLANIIATICCTEMEVDRKNKAGEWELVKRNVLPQGAPTSPIFTNIICQKLDNRLAGVAKRFGLKYSRYADDITFSSMHNVYQPNSEFLNELHRIIEDQGFYVNKSKTRLQKNGYRKEVTGLLVNDKVNVQSRYIKQLRMWLYYWERYGYERAYSFFIRQYKIDKGHVKKGKSDMASVINGKLDYLKMVKGSDNELYLKLKGRFDSLTITNIEPKANLDDTIATETDANEVRISLEVYRSPDLIKKLNNSVTIPKDTNIPSTLIIQNSTVEDEVEEDTKPKKLFPHNPSYTISFLKKFKIGDGSGFKELVHDVILTDETIHDIINKVKCHPNFIYHYKKEWISDVSFLNVSIQKEVIKLIDLFEKEGLPFYKNSHKHPFNNDSEYTNYARQFKKKYRYGSGSEYSKLQSDIINIFNDQRVPVSSLSFMPDERKFNIRSSFFTWQPSIYNGIRYIVQGICDHSNIDGVRPFNPTEKNVLVEVERMQSESISYVELRIFDCKSVAKIDSKTLFHFFQGSSPYKFEFRNLCDWIVECDFLEESSKRINLLTAPENSQSLQEIEVLPSVIDGFKHILRFYDAS